MDMELIHDLRLPLQLIQSSAQMLELVSGAEGREYLDVLMDSVAQLGRMLDSALDGAEAQPFKPVEVVGLLRALCLRCRDYAGRRGVRLAFSGNVEALRLVTDGDRLSRIVLNLVMNALRFSPVGGAVSVRCTALGDFVEVSVTDGGRGIAPERLPYLFLRGETDGGRGYGLPSALEGAKRLGGTLSARSELGQGSTFTLRLPVQGRMVS